MKDEKGSDEKVLSVPKGDPRFQNTNELKDVAPHFLREVEHFFTIYKELEGTKVATYGWEDRQAAYKMIMASLVSRERE